MRHLASIGLLITSIVAGCGTERPPNNNVIEIGSILGLSGDNAAYGEAMRNGFELAIDSVNRAGGINGHIVNLRIEDSQFDPAKAMSAYRKLRSANDVRIFVGITGSRNAIPIAQAATNEDVVIIDALGSAPKLSSVGGGRYFRVMASDALAGRFNADWAVEGGARSFAIVYVEDEWGESYKDELAAHLLRKGVRDVPQIGVLPGTRDFRAAIEQVRNAPPDALFLLVYAKEGAGFMQQLRQARVPSVVYGSDNLSTDDFIAAGATVVEGVRVALPAQVSGAEFEMLKRIHEAKYSTVPDANVIKSFDAMRVALDAIANAGSEPAAIRSYLTSPNYSFRGASGIIKFDERGDLVDQSYSRQEYRNGKLADIAGE